MSTTLAIEVADDVFAALQEDASQLAGEMRLLAAMKWYEAGRISQSMAASLAGLPRSAFVDALSRQRISPFQEAAEEIRRGLGK